MKWLRKIFGSEEVKEVKEIKTDEDIRREALAREKEEATRKGEAWVGVLDTKVNPHDIKNGFFELDWNNEFLEQLLDAGYHGETQEEIVNAWFTTLIRQMLEEEGLDSERDVGYIKVVPSNKKGRSEVS
jgi:hypothetical protein